jgi:hypothetical protein
MEEHIKMRAKLHDSVNVFRIKFLLHSLNKMPVTKNGQVLWL